jgi:hypothetical protein
MNNAFSVRRRSLLSRLASSVVVCAGEAFRADVARADSSPVTKTVVAAQAFNHIHTIFRDPTNDYSAKMAS